MFIVGIEIMKLVDEVEIEVFVGNGGNGCIGFCCEKFILFGGLDGGDGGVGGSVYICVDENLNILVDFCYDCIFKVQCGENGMGCQVYGKGGEDLIIIVLVGIVVINVVIDEVIGDLIQYGDCLLVVKGGCGGLGNMYFKSLINCLLCQVLLGELGEECMLKLELKLLVDVGLLGFFNVGKSILICVVLVVMLKVVDYLFIMLYLNLGVVKVENYCSFVIVDILGLIEGVVDGVGLGVQFLCYLQCICLLLYLVDILLMEGGVDGILLVEQVCVIECELEKYDLELFKKLCWLVLNKVDLMFEDEVQVVVEQIVVELGWKELWFLVFVLGCEGIFLIMSWIMVFFDCQKEEEQEVCDVQQS